ncbi:hypothetical protein CXB49_09615 [Chromobacterium sp. ATCC 53434]|uniref:DUF2726 domain-containing protein n=1 Tax=Chromobacterium TaxID=535 RepID=UPI000C7612A1|nr:DUF2726 domain-containing protein [Chromobacterium sp. ATCC 53434]AUH51051.1 hypothetical protein CXB49_09615 [Chromobacterium sp. ATCC 53434]
MTYILALLVLGLLSALVFVSKNTARRPAVAKNGVNNSKFSLKRKTLLTPREIDCYKLLVKELGPDFVVFSQVAFSQILNVTGGNHSENRRLWMTMSQKVADFVICDPDLAMLAVLELDDRSHQDKQDKDRQRDLVIQGIGLKVFRITGPARQEDVASVAIRLRGKPLTPVAPPRQAQRQTASQTSD